MNDDLDRYRQKRNFDVTPEPRGDRVKAGNQRFVIQMHAARRLHYDFRLEHGGVLLSWAVPKGPSLDPKEKRLAVRTEDHPIDYADFEGTIPAGEYGGGRVLVWDQGQWIPEGDPTHDMGRGRLHFSLRGEKLRGRWNLIRTKDDDNWLLIKSRDEFAQDEPEVDIVDELPLSVLTGRSIDEIEETERYEPGADRKPRENSEDAENSDQADQDLPIIDPQLAVLVEEVPEGPEWLHEIKLDGYRLLAYVRPGGVRLRTRGGEDWTDRLADIASELANPRLVNSVLDGELCALDAKGVARFELLQQALAERRTGDLVFYAFDLPFADGKDLRGEPLIERKRILRERIDSIESRRALRYSDHVLGMGDKVFDSACALGAEGVVSKRIRSIYEGRRTRTWRKIKCPSRLHVHVGGFTAPRGSRNHFGALLVGNFDDEGQLRYRGKVGAGYSEASLAMLQPKLEQLRQATPPFVDPPTGSEARGVTWVEPKLEIDVAYGELTESGKLRHGRFERLIEPAPDPEPAPERRAQNESSPSIRLTHPDRVFYPEPGLSKRDVADYIMQVSDWMLPHVRDRVLTMVRCPDGVAGDCFYQKNAMPGLPESVVRVPVQDSDGDELIYPAVADALGLVGLIQMSVLEFHVWGSRIDKIDYPDRLVFDIDPDEGLEFARVIAAAIEIRDRLTELGLTSFVKTTGGKGLHVVAPVQRRRDFDEAKAFCRAFAMRMVADAPDRYVAVASKAERRGKIFIDYLRNGRGATSIAAYSPRAKPSAPVSTPLRWDELGPSLRPAAFTLTTIPARLAELEGDPWDGLFDLRQSITKASLRAFGLAGDED